MGGGSDGQPRRSALIAGAVAALAALAIGLAFRLGAGAPLLAELVESWLIARFPAPLFAVLLNTFGNLAKPALTYLLILSQIPIGALIGLAYVWWWPRPSPDQIRRGIGPTGIATSGRRGWLAPVTFAALLWLITGLVILPIAGNGFFALGQSGQVGPILLALATGQLAFALLTHAIYVTFEAPLVYGADLSAEVRPGRRSSLQWIAVGSLAVVSAGLAGRLLVELGRLATITQTIKKGLGFLPPEITPNDDFYVVSKNFIDPTLHADTWRLKVDGLVDRTLDFTFEDLRSLPPVELYLTLECISNPVGGNLISNAHWRGVRLRDVLARAGVRPGAVDLAMYAADDYSDSIRIEKALHPDTTLVYEMNGESLSSQHGFPVRLLVPGIHGEKNVKWITRLEVVDYDFKGYWQKQGWSDTAEIHTMSRIDVPRRGEAVPGDSVFFGGVAFAGDRGIRQVEVSVDLGRTWHAAVVKPALSPFTWVLWSFEWDRPAPGSHAALVRAIDGTGEVQTRDEQDIYPDGATGYHTVNIRVLPV